jgi:hypothetical protein
MLNILSHKQNANPNNSEIPCHYSQNSSHQENTHQNLVRMQWKKDTSTLLMGMYASVHTSENSTKFPQKGKDKITM